MYYIISGIISHSRWDTASICVKWLSLDSLYAELSHFNAGVCQQKCMLLLLSHQNIAKAISEDASHAQDATATARLRASLALSRLKMRAK